MNIFSQKCKNNSEKELGENITFRIGKYGPYMQSERSFIYNAVIYDMVCKGLAYPCFCSTEELSEMRENQETMKTRTGYHGRFARCSRLTVEEAIEKINNGEKLI